MAKGRPASKILWTAAALGLLLIFASALATELRRAREERACEAGDLQACVTRCVRGSDTACALLAHRCRQGAQSACEAAEAAKGARTRRARW